MPPFVHSFSQAIHDDETQRLIHVNLELTSRYLSWTSRFRLPRLYDPLVRNSAELKQRGGPVEASKARNIPKSQTLRYHARHAFAQSPVPGQIANVTESPVWLALQRSLQRLICRPANSFPLLTYFFRVVSDRLGEWPRVSLQAKYQENKRE